MRPLLLLALVLGLAACDGTIDDDLDPQIVVSASLGVGEPLPPVYLSRVAPLLDVYDPDAVGLRAADVTVSRLAPDGSVEQAVPYAATQTPGTFRPTVAGAVLPGRTYRLDVVADGERLTATTVTPPPLTLVQGPPPAVPYGQGQGPELVIESSSTPERPARFVISARALAPATFVPVDVGGERFFRSVPDPATFLPTPAYARFLDCAPEPEGTLLCGDNPRTQGIEIGQSPVLNEDGYQDLADGTLLVQVPFLAFGFYGPTAIRLVSVDAALEAYVESTAVQAGGSTLSPGEIPNVITNVEGGLGVFGSYARLDVETAVVER